MILSVWKHENKDILAQNFIANDLLVKIFFVFNDI